MPSALPVRYARTAKTTQITATPTLELVASDGTELPNDGKWRLILTDGGRKLKFGPMVGTRILVK